jgi:integrase
MAGVRKKPIRGGNYQGWFINATRKRQYFTGTHDRPDTLRMAQRLEDEHRQVRLGYRPAQESADRHKTRPIDEVINEYLEWGAAQGGLGGRPWSVLHAGKRRTHLTWWREGLGLATLADLGGVLPRMETELRGLQAKGKAGKTIANYAEALTAFCDWSVQRGFLAEDPLKALAPFDTTPQTRRRSMSQHEITRLLSACASHRRLLLETAFLSGLRVNELRNLTLDHLDTERPGLHLDAEWTKNRSPGFQPLPAQLAQRLSESAKSGEPGRLYEKFQARRDATRLIPTNPLLFVPTSLSRAFDADLKTAGIPKSTSAGKLDFHAIRLAYINLVLDSDLSARDAQALARHSTPNLTFNVYGRARDDRMAEAVEHMAARVLPVPERVTCVQQLVAAPERENATTVSTGSCVSQFMVEPRGIEPLTS